MAGIGLCTPVSVIFVDPAAGSAMRANASGLRSMWPASQSGQESTTVTRTVPRGPVTSMVAPHAAPAAYHGGGMAT